MNRATRTSPSSLPEKALFALLSHLRAGELIATSSDGVTRHFTGSAEGPSASIAIKSRSAATRLFAGQSIGLAEGYIAGEWDTPDLDAVLRLGLANIAEEPVGLPHVLNPAQRLWHLLRDNSISGSRRNIAEHYDLGNDFYRLMLDDTMAYSSAIFESGAEELERAQVRKWDRLLELLQPTRKDRVLEIGCGWGGFAIYAAREAGCRVTGVTLSREQHDWAVAEVQRAGLEDRVDIRLEDYRCVDGSFEAIASIEMFEAVGHRWWPVFFGRLAELLGRGGAVALQTITIDDARFAEYAREPDFIQRYVFPGGMLPSPERFSAAASAAGLHVGAPTFFGDSYARTLERWRERFEAALPQVQALGYDERFVRLWRYYLAYCRTGFDAGIVDVMQVRLEA